MLGVFYLTYLSIYYKIDLTVWFKPGYLIWELSSLMAKAPSKKSETTVTRIKASDSSAPATKSSAIAKKPTTKVAKKTAPKVVEVKVKKSRKNPFAAIGAYFKGAWHELRQVRWPDRRSTWGMTGALIAFTVFFIIVILVIDFAFGQLFNLITGK